MASLCQRCSAVFTSNGHTHVHCPRCIGKRFREDITALAEKTLFPGMPYEKLSKAQRMQCNELAHTICHERRLPGFGVNRYGETGRRSAA